MKKVLILANSSVGLFSFRNELVLELIKKYDVYASLPDTEFVKELQQEGCKVINTPIDRRGVNPLKDLKLFFSYLKLLGEIKPDVVLTYTIKPNVYGGVACRIKKVPFLANVTGLGTALQGEGILQKITGLMYKTGLKGAQNVFFQNRDNLDFFVNNRMIKSTATLLPGSGVNTTKFSLLPWPDKGTEFIFIGRIMKEKGIEEYFECARTIKKDYPEVVFNILGPCEDEYEDRLKEMNEAGIVRYMGSVKDVRPYLAASKCLIHPSYHEGMSNVCLEAASSGRVVITNDIPGCRETVSAGKTGFIVQPKNAEKLIEAVRTFLEMSEEEASRMGIAGREFVTKNFDRTIVVNEYMNRIEQIAD